MPGGDGRHHREATVLAAGDQCEHSVSHDVLNFQRVMLTYKNLRRVLSVYFSSMPFCFDFITESDLPQVFHIMSLDGVCNWI